MKTSLVFILVSVQAYSLNTKMTAQIKKDLRRSAIVCPKEQERFASLFQNNKQQKEAWGLFSYGGYMDQGQITIYKDKSPVQYHIFYVKPQITSSKRIDGTFTHQRVEKKPTLNTIEIFIKQVTIGQSLEHLSYPIFDAVSYEYIHLTKKHNDQIIIKNRLYMNAPMFSNHPKKQDYLDLITAFKQMASVHQ